MVKKSNHCLKTFSNGGVEGNSDLIGKKTIIKL